MGNSPDSMNSIFESHAFITRSDKVFHNLQVRGFAWLETLGVMEHKMRILWGGDFDIDIRYTVFLM
jgi:hypothetical protein